MKRLDRFILKSFIGPFFAVFLVVVFILMMQTLWLYIDELVGKGLALKVILEFLMWGTCLILPLALPLSTLLSSVMTLGQMTENNELMALKAAGVSIIRIMTPLAITCAFVSLGAFWISDNLVPKAYNEIVTLREDIGRTKDEIKIPSGTFYNGIEGYILRVDEEDKDGIMHGVLVYDHTDKKGNTKVTIADSAMMRMSKGKDYLIFTLFSGTNYQENNTKKFRDTTLELQTISFQKQELIISLKNYAFHKSEEAQYGNQTRSKDVAQLIHEHDSLRTLREQMHAKHKDQFYSNANFVLRKQVDSSFSTAGVQTFDRDDFGVWKKRRDMETALRKASEKASNVSSQVASLTHEVYTANYYLRRGHTETLKRFAQALACFVLFFIGAPLGALVGKGGLGANAIVSVLFFVLYWVIDISGIKLANDGAVAPPIGAFISTYVLFPLGLFMTWKAAHDSSFGNMDSLKAKFRALKSRISRLFHRTRIVYMGTPEFAVGPLNALIEAKYNVVGVVTVADKPSGRGLKMNESAVKKYAVAHGLPVLQPDKLKDPVFLEQLKALKADLFVVVGFRMLPEVVWGMPKLGTFNLHAALLPQYRGAAPINWAVINGERITGVTTFMIDKEIDTGGIILRQECRIEPEDTAGDVHDKLMEIGSKLVVETVEGIIQHNIETRVQRSFIQGDEVLKPAPKLTKETCMIDWNQPTTKIYNQIRGLSPYPTAFTDIVKEGSSPIQMKIYFGKKVEEAQGVEPGTILSDGKTYLNIATADGAISVTDLQISGKKRMDVKSFLLGFREPESWKAVHLEPLD